MEPMIDRSTRYYEFLSIFCLAYFSAPPGVLIGHFTQLCWAQAWRIGCGKIYYHRTGDKYVELNL